MARRMVNPQTIRKEDATVIINNAMTVEDNGDVVVGKDLEVNGTIEAAAFTDGETTKTMSEILSGGGKKLYKHTFSFGGDKKAVIIMDFNTPLTFDEIYEVFKMPSGKDYNNIEKVIMYDNEGFQYMALASDITEHTPSIVGIKSVNYFGANSTVKETLTSSMTDVVTEA